MPEPPDQPSRRYASRPRDVNANLRWVAERAARCLPATASPSQPRYEPLPNRAINSLPVGLSTIQSPNVDDGVRIADFGYQSRQPRRRRSVFTIYNICNIYYKSNFTAIN